MSGCLPRGDPDGPWAARPAAPGARRACVSFLVKDAPSDELIGALRRVAAGERVIDPQVALTLETAGSPLSTREAEVLGRFASGADPAEIAAELFLSYGTVRNYLASAVTKLGGRNRMDCADRHGGWVAVGPQRDRGPFDGAVTRDVQTT